MSDPAPNGLWAPGGTPAANSAETGSRAAHLRMSGMAMLLVLIVGTVFVAPALLPFGTAWRVFTDGAFALILLSGVVATADHRRLAAALAVLSVVVIAVRWTEWLVPAAALPAFREVSTLLALLVLAFSVGINVFAASRTIGDRIFGAVTLYLLLGLIWAVAYAAIESAMPGSFAGKLNPQSALADWAYFSFVTLTTVGYGDITPVARAARSLAMLEALIGQLYPAIIIARLVSLGPSNR
jgi:VanZ family protein